MRVNRALIVTLTVTVASSAGCVDQTAEGANAVVVANTVQHTIPSQIMDRAFSVQVALPRNYDPAEGEYPVLYMLDSNAHFGLVTDIARALTLLPDERELPDLIVVGVGYLAPSFYDAIGVRTADLTPTRDTAYERMWPQDWSYLPPIDRPTGSGSDLLRFITDELAPQIDSAYRTNPADRALLGHSFGGLFTLFALLERPGFFSRYLAVSPSVWWNCDPDPNQCWGEDGLPGVFFEREATARQRGTELSGRLFLAVGLAEAPHMVGGARQVASVLAADPNPRLDWTLQEFDGDTHQSVVPAAVSNGLRWLYSAEGR